MIILTDEMIDHLIGARNRLTHRRDELIDVVAVDHIDEVFAHIPIGQRPDVDALLGRNIRWSVNPRTTLDNLPASVIAKMDTRCAETWRDDAKDDAAGRPW